MALLERDAELAVLDEALASAAAGAGSVVLVSGEAGIGKSSLLRAFLQVSADRARILHGACDDLIAPRTFGPLRDAVARGPLAEALTAGNRDAVFTAVLNELIDPIRPTVLVVEDVHWADDASLDVLRFVGRRVVDLPAVVVLTYRDDEIGPDHPLQRVLGALGGPGVHRLRLGPLSRGAVARLSGGTAATSAGLYRLTAGNPFFVTEALATPDDTVPRTVADAVLARVRRLDAATRAALDRLAVVPSRVGLPLARTLLDDLTVLGEAERLGIVEVDPAAVAFRHELARRAVEASMPRIERMQLNARVLAALRAQPDPDPAQVVHHAVEAGDDAAVVDHAPGAAAAAHRAGAYAQEVTFYRYALSRDASRDLVPVAEQAAMWQACALALFTLDRMPEALAAGRSAVRLREELGDEAALGEALVALATSEWVVLGPRASVETAERAVRLLEHDGASARRTWALAYLGLLRTTVDDDQAALLAGQAAVDMADRLGVAELQAFACLTRGVARLRLGDEHGVSDLTGAVRTAADVQQHSYVLMGYVLLTQRLWQWGRFDEVEQFVDAGLTYAHEHDVDLDLYLDALAAHRFLLQALRGEWATAEAGLRNLIKQRDGIKAGAVPYRLPHLARLLIRRGADDAADVLGWAVDDAARAGWRDELIPTVLAQLEQAWLTGQDTHRARRSAGELLARLEGRGSERARGELLRWLRRLGDPVEPFDGCPPEFAAGLRCDWRTAAEAWERIGDPYEQALELLDSAEITPTLQALSTFDALEAVPAARIARRRLRDLGVRQVPRGPQPATRANPAGLTDRQVEILSLLRDGLTNAEIAERLVVSVRTVDHHVSAVLQKLGVASRRDAAAAAVRLGPVPEEAVDRTGVNSDRAGPPLRPPRAAR
jgi:DNA-binding CsgD family transcriptional regulator